MKLPAMATGLLAALVWHAATFAALAAPPPAAEIAGLITRLADESFAARQEASEKLLTRGHKQPAEVEKSLAHAFRHSDDPEIRFRSKEILMKLFMESVGYIGVGYQRQDHLDAQGNRQWVLILTKIADDSPAKTVELQVGDLIFAVNRKALDQTAPELDFTTRIQTMRAGQPVVLSLSRNGKEMEIKVVLGRRPENLSLITPETLFDKRLQEIEQKAAKPKP